MDIITEPERFEEVADNIAKYYVIRRVYAVTDECRFRAEGFASGNAKCEMFMRSVKKHLKGIKSIMIQDVQYTIKDLDGGVDYVRPDEKDNKT